MIRTTGFLPIRRALDAGERYLFAWDGTLFEAIPAEPAPRRSLLDRIRRRPARRARRETLRAFRPVGIWLQAEAWAEVTPGAVPLAHDSAEGRRVFLARIEAVRRALDAAEAQLRFDYSTQIAMGEA